MDILKLGTNLLLDKLGDNFDSATVSAALMGLLGGSGDKLDLTDLITKFTQSGDLQSIVSSWLSDGENKAISSKQILSSLGDDKVSAFASQLGIDKDVATDNLADTLPHMLRGASNSSGSILSMAKKFF